VLKRGKRLRRESKSNLMMLKGTTKKWSRKKREKKLPSSRKSKRRPKNRLKRLQKTHQHQECCLLPMLSAMESTCRTWRQIFRQAFKQRLTLVPPSLRSLPKPGQRSFLHPLLQHNLSSPVCLPNIM